MLKPNFIFLLLVLLLSVNCYAVEENNHEKTSDYHGGENIEEGGKKDTKQVDVVANEFKINDISDKQELVLFDQDVKWLIENAPIGDARVSDIDVDYSRKVDSFCIKYAHKFPFGRIQRTIFSDITIRPGCGGKLHLDNKKTYPYNKLVDVITQKAISPGGTKGGKQKKDNYYIVAFLIEREVSAFPWACSYVDFAARNKKISSACASFFSAHPKLLKASGDGLSFYKKFREEEAIVGKIVNSFVCVPGVSITSQNARIVEEKMSHLCEMMQDGRCTDFLAYRSIYYLWILRGYAEKTGNKKMEESMRVLLADVEEKAKHEHWKKWSKEALDPNLNSDHIPKRIWIGKLIPMENGILGVDEDGDGKPDHPYNPKDYE